MFWDTIFTVITLVVAALWIVSLVLMQTDKHDIRRRKWGWVVAVTFLLLSVEVANWMLAYNRPRNEILFWINGGFACTIWFLAIFEMETLYEKRSRDEVREILRKYKDRLNYSAEIIKKYQKHFGTPEAWKESIDEFWYYYEEESLPLLWDNYEREF
jgi:hypothetical protein